MRKFIFPLQKVLELRKHNENECKIELGRSLSILNKIENDIQEIAKKKHNASAQIFNNTDDIISWNNFILWLEQQKEILMEQAAKAEIVVEEKRALYLEASKELKIIEKLKEKREKEYRKEMLKQDMERTDDLTNARFNERL